jgi:hypothetical protein
MPELDLSTGAVQFVIDKAHEFQSRDDVMLPDDGEENVPDEDMVMQVATDFGNDAYYQELTTTINDLDPDQQMSLVALMWVGRGDYSLDEWAEALKFAEETWTDHTGEYLVSTPLLADYLQEGLQLFETEGA